MLENVFFVYHHYNKNHYTSKFYCSTREIKPNQTDIGRKVKVKQSRTSIVPPTRRETPPLRDSLLKPSYQSNNNTSSSSSSTSSLKPLGGGGHLNSGLSNGLGSNTVSSTRPLQNKPSVPDIARRPIKWVGRLWLSQGEEMYYIQVVCIGKDVTFVFLVYDRD